MLIDDFLPTYLTVERHRTRVRASAARTYQAIRTTDLSAALPVRALLAVRFLKIRRTKMTLRDFERRGFTVLAEDPPCELLIGLVGAFWTPGGGVHATDATQFRTQLTSGTARAAWNFVVQERGDGVVDLSTETRVQPADAASARRFRLYWTFVRPWSGLIRRYMLNAIRREAEGR